MRKPTDDQKQAVYEWCGTGLLALGLGLLFASLAVAALTVGGWMLYNVIVADIRGG